MSHLEQTALILDIDGVIRDVSGSYLRALADTVEHFTGFRPSAVDIDNLKAEGRWNNDWEASHELIRRYFAQYGEQTPILPTLDQVITFFQGRYRGTSTPWNGYITQEPLLVDRQFFEQLSLAQINWGFFSGATRASAEYVLHRLGIKPSVLIAMEDAPGKPHPEGLFLAIAQFAKPINTVIYAGDTVADMLTVVHARQQDPSKKYLAVGIIPPHVEPSRRASYRQTLIHSGADLVCDWVRDLHPQAIADII